MKFVIQRHDHYYAAVQVDPPRYLSRTRRSFTAIDDRAQAAIFYFPYDAANAVRSTFPDAIVEYGVNVSDNDGYDYPGCPYDAEKYHNSIAGGHEYPDRHFGSKQMYLDIVYDTERQLYRAETQRWGGIWEVVNPGFLVSTLDLLRFPLLTRLETTSLPEMKKRLRKLYPTIPAAETPFSFRRRKERPGLHPWSSMPFLEYTVCFIHGKFFGAVYNAYEDQYIGVHIKGFPYIELGQTPYPIAEESGLWYYKHTIFTSVEQLMEAVREEFPTWGPKMKDGKVYVHDFYKLSESFAAKR
jgi:hypothetical protein